jgi:hypothetical protein
MWLMRIEVSLFLTLTCLHCAIPLSSFDKHFEHALVEINQKKIDANH